MKSVTWNIASAYSRSGGTPIEMYKLADEVSNMKYSISILYLLNASLLLKCISWPLQWSIQKVFPFRMIITVFWASYFLQITMLLFKFYFDKWHSNCCLKCDGLSLCFKQRAIRIHNSFVKLYFVVDQHHTI